MAREVGAALDLGHHGGEARHLRRPDHAALEARPDDAGVVEDLPGWQPGVGMEEGQVPPKATSRTTSPAERVTTESPRECTKEGTLRKRTETGLPFSALARTGSRPEGTSMTISVSGSAAVTTPLSMAQVASAMVPWPPLTILNGSPAVW